MNPEPFVNPPVYTIIMVSNFFAIAFGFIFKDMLEYQVAQWDSNRQSHKQITYDTPNIRIAYIGMCIFISLFMGASLSVFGLVSWLSYAIGAVIVLLPALLVWVQLGSMLSLLVSGGSEAVDIDSYGAGQKFDVQAPKPSK
jgi:Na+-transporting NADH:ubiquinone oxidoreductase subunit NqrB